jgi:8-oxo-dGTP pyrophosphatase MutT (NUDIX family)
MRRRAFCYITRKGPDGLQLLVFQHPDPAAGVQTPGGTIDAGETPQDGAVREAIEETGLTGFRRPRLLAVDTFEGQDETVERYHVHLPTQGPTADRWDHTVTHGEADAGMRFHLFWLGFAEARQRVWPWMITHLDALELQLGRSKTGPMDPEGTDREVPT